MKKIKSIYIRRSPRKFSDKKITEKQINLLFEAARWAPSARNEQPWHYYYAPKKNTDLFNKMIDCLVPANKEWAKNAEVIILSVGSKIYSKNETPNVYYKHDVGAANAYLALQAAKLGFQVHQMAGFYAQKAIELLNLDDKKLEPITFIAVGYELKPEELSESERIIEFAERTRKNIGEFVTKL
ncbi:MAG: nitroreductase family protein [Bacteroidales bacterium]|nr:nitroreductase family protein [Bacteroidales bacterium]